MKKFEDQQEFDQEILRMQKEFIQYLELKNKLKPWKEALKIIVLYLLIGCLWILLSDRLAELIFKDHDILSRVQMIKGWFYVLTTGFVFYLIVKNKLHLFEESINKILERYEDLNSTQEELMAMNEELIQQNEELDNQRKSLEMSELRYQLAVEGANDGIWDWDLINNTYFFSIPYKKQFGYANGSLDNTIDALKSIFCPQEWEDACEYVHKYLDSKQGMYENTYKLITNTGEYRYILSRGKGIWDDSGKPVRIAGSHTDITGYIQLQEILRNEKELSENIISDAPIIIVICDKECRISRFNPYAEQVTGMRNDEVIGKFIYDVLKTGKEKERYVKRYQSILQGEKVSSSEMRILNKNGDYVTILWNNNLLYDKTGEVQGLVSIGVDISERILMENKLNKLAYYDVLTGLPNRFLFEKTIEEKIAEIFSDNTYFNHYKMAVLYLDIDDFKSINDTMGHAQGDLLLLHVAQLLSDQIKGPNIVARIGGDEFGILIMDIPNSEFLLNMIYRFYREFKKPCMINEQKFYFTISTGIALFPDHATQASVLLQKADTALFHSKDSGKDKYSLYHNEMYDEALKLMQLRSQLTNAILNNEFVLYYQPQVDLKSGRIIAVEALVRWEHPEKGLVSPIEFIPFAESTGQIREIDKWVLKTAVRQKKAWADRGLNHIKMSVNLSGQVIVEADIVKEIKDILDETKINPAELEIEVTETAVMDEIIKAKYVLQEIMSLGVTIALDDFGTGYSSLTYLQKLPLNILKIDRAFIKNILEDNSGIHIFKMIVELAHNLKLQVVSEGVETEEQKHMLIDSMCDIAQGYYFSKPLPADEIEKIL